MSKVIVPPEGSKDSLIAFAGQAPGHEEVKRGRPFCGRAGQTLDELLRLVGISRHECYITNVLKEHPSDGAYMNDEDIKNWIYFQKGRVIATARFLEYAKQLKEELSSVKANVIVPVGNEAMWALTGYWGITKRRGSILEYEDGRKLIPIIHPAAALREYMYYHMIRADLKRIKDESKFPEIILPIRNLRINPSFLDVEAYLARVRLSKRVDTDIEVINEEMSMISFALSATDGICIPFVESGHPYWPPDQELQIMLWIAEIMENPNIVKENQFIIFDTSFLYRKYGIRSTNLKDTMVAMSILFPDFPRGLDFSTSLYTKEPYYKDEGKKWRNFGGDERRFRLYNAKDSAVNFEIMDKLPGELERQKNTDAFNVQNALIEPLMYMQARGLRVNVEGLRKASEEAEIKIAELQEKLNLLCGYELNPNSPQQVANYFYGVKKCRPYFYKGSITTNMNAMKRIARQGFEEANIVLAVKKLVKLKGTYLDVTLSEDGRLRSSMSPGKTRSGRLASSEDIFGEGTNVQNLPDVFKQFVIADDDFILYNLDISQGENRIVAHIAPEPIQIQAFAQHRDMHTLTASLVFGMPYEEVSDEPGSSPLGNGEQSERYWGKKLNHSLNYGMGYKKFALDFELPENESKLLVERWHQVYPGIRQYHEWVKIQLGKDRTLINPYGRKRLFLERWGDELFKAAYDYIPQSTVAYKVNKQGIEYIWDHYQTEIDLLNQVHDSLVLQIPKYLSFEIHAKILLDIVRELETPIRWKSIEFTLPVDVSTGMNLSKKALKGVSVNGANVEGLARQLHEIYSQQRTEAELPVMDGSERDSSSATA